MCLIVTCGGVGCWFFIVSCLCMAVALFLLYELILVFGLVVNASQSVVWSFAFSFAGFIIALSSRSLLIQYIQGTWRSLLLLVINECVYIMCCKLQLSVFICCCQLLMHVHIFCCHLLLCVCTYSFFFFFLYMWRACAHLKYLFQQNLIIVTNRYRILPDYLCWLYICYINEFESNKTRRVRFGLGILKVCVIMDLVELGLG